MQTNNAIDSRFSTPGLRTKFRAATPFVYDALDRNLQSFGYSMTECTTTVACMLPPSTFILMTPLDVSFQILSVFVCSMRFISADSFKNWVYY